MQPGGTKYSLIPDEDEEKVEAKAADFDKADPTKNSRKRKKVSAILLLFYLSCFLF